MRALFAGRRGGPPIAPGGGAIGGLIALVAAAMGFLAAAAAIAGLAAGEVAGRWSADLARVATVRVWTPEADGQGAREAAVTAALSVLAVTPGVAEARLIDEAAQRALLAPWLGAEADVSALPLPSLIDVRLEGAGPDVADVSRQLSAAAPGAEWDDHGEWRGPLIRAADRVRQAAAAGVALAAAALAAMVAVAAAATLWSGAGVVRTLRMIGAEDAFISRAFAGPFALRAALGAGAGALAAAALPFTLPQIGVETGLETGLAAGADLIVLAPLLVLSTALVAGLTALAATRAAAWLVLRRG